MTAVDRRAFLKQGGLATAAAGTLAVWPAFAEAAIVPVTIDSRAVSGALPHIWSECAGSDRAAITLRESWRHDLDRWRTEAGLKRVRFHGIFNDELGVDAPSILSRGDRPPNFQNVDRVYDGLVEHGVSPFVELGFMPQRLASGTRTFGFYAGNVTPPTSADAWAGFIKAFVTHLIDRYGIAAIRAWPFEIWNEPNLAPFWTGTQQQYFELYKATAVAIKSIDPALQVGGPATSSIQWLPEFLGYCAQNNAPVDFVSTHVYAGDNQAKLFGPTDRYPQADVIPQGVRNARKQIDATMFAKRPLWLSEWSCDSPAMIAHIIKECLPHAHAMSHWTLSGTYEELGVPDFILKEGDMGWSTMVQGIAKPSFNTYKLLHALGTSRLESQGPALASRRTNGSVAALVWNLADVKQAAGLPGASNVRNVVGEAKRYDIAFPGARPGQPVHVRFVDQVRGSPLPAWRAMGSPQYPTFAQIKQLRQRADVPPAVVMKLDAARRLKLDLPPEGIALIELA
jgi:xylan 1,4-beta-xylosidase